MSGFAFPLACIRESIKLPRRTLRCYKDWDEHWADTTTNIVLFIFLLTTARGSSFIDYFFIFVPFYKDAASHNAFQSKISTTFRSSVLNYLWHDFLLFEQSTYGHGKMAVLYNLSGKMLALYSFIYRYLVCVCLIFTIVVGAVGEGETLCKMASLNSSWY